jgi:glycosyltransferase involved in cell wall biosynthesis
MKIVYFGYNAFNQYKRGVENVIDFQSKSKDFDLIYYIHWGEISTAYKNNRFACISIKNCWYWPVLLNIILFRLCRKNKVILHSHNALFSFFSLKKTNILTVHDGLYYLNKSKHTKGNPLFYLIEKCVYYRCSLVHFISDYAKAQSLFGKQNNFIIIPNTSHFEPLVSSVGDVLQGSKSINKNILIVRSIEERARFDLLIQVVEQTQNNKFQFMVAGKGPLLEYYQEIINKNNMENIEMPGYLADKELLQLYSNCDLVLMIAEYGEGFGLPIIEGYLFNKPVIASNKCAIPEVIISKAYLFENTVNDIIQSINFAFSIQHENFRTYYDKKFSNSIVLEQFRKLYTNIHP